MDIAWVRHLHSRAQVGPEDPPSSKLAKAETSGESGGRPSAGPTASPGLPHGGARVCWGRRVCSTWMN